MNYLKVSKAAENWVISPRRVRILCAEGKIPGVIRKGKLYMIPENAVKPADSRLSGSTIYSNLVAQNEHVSKLRPMIEGEVERLNKKVMFEPLYNTNEEEKIISAGVTYFYLCGVLEEDNISLNVVDSYRCLPDEFYNRVFSIIANTDKSQDIIHMFGVIGAHEKIEKITDVVESGLNNKSLLEVSKSNKSLSIPFFLSNGR